MTFGNWSWHCLIISEIVLKKNLWVNWFIFNCKITPIKSVMVFITACEDRGQLFIKLFNFKSYTIQNQ